MSFKEIINADEPKSPVSKGSKGCLTGRFNEKKPRKPAKMKIVNDKTGEFSLSVK